MDTIQTNARPRNPDVHVAGKQNMEKTAVVWLSASTVKGNMMPRITGAKKRQNKGISSI